LTGRAPIRAAAVLAAIIALVLAAPVAAHPVPRDVAATRLYLRADLAFLASAENGLPAGIAAAQRLATTFNSECSNALGGAPTGGQLFELRQEEFEVVAYTLIQPDAAAAVRFAHAIGHLRWHSSRLTKLVHAYAAQDLAELRLALPNMCADMRAWVASGYRTLPADTSRFVKETEGTESQEASEMSMGSAEAISHRLAPYQDAAARRLRHRVAHLLAQLKHSLTGALLAAVTAIHNGAPYGG
jgi:hypothetical protein